MTATTHWVDRRSVPRAGLVLLAVVGFARAAAITSAAVQDPTQRIVLVTGDALACLALLVDAVLLFEISCVVGQAVGGKAGRRRLSWLVVVALVISVAGYLSRAQAEKDPFWPEVGMAAVGMLGLLATAYAAAGKARLPAELGQIPLPLWLGAAAAGTAAAAVLAAPLARSDGARVGLAIHEASPVLGLCLLGLLAAVLGGEDDRWSGSIAVPGAVALAVFGLTRNLGAAVVLFAGAYGIVAFRPGSSDGGHASAARVARYLGSVLATGVALWLLAGLLATMGGRFGESYGAVWHAPAGEGTYTQVARGLGLGPAGAVAVAGVMVLLLIQLAGCGRRCRDDLVGRWAIGAICALAAQAVLAALAPLGVAGATSVAVPLLGPDGTSYWVTLVAIGLVLGASCRQDGVPATAPAAHSAGQLATGGRP